MKFHGNRKPVYGIGINDADYSVYKTINGKTVICPFYATWKDILKRCYDTKFHSRQPTYSDCSICDEWHLFSAFREWMVDQEWQGKELDKDFLVQGNKVYSPQTCVFVAKQLNTFLIDCGATRGSCLIGASWNKRERKFRANCRNPFTKKLEHLGSFADELSAHLAWRNRKHELACQYAVMQTDQRIAEALRTRFLPDLTGRI